MSAVRATSDVRFAQHEELALRSFFERELEGVHRLERASEAARALAGGSRQRGDATETFGEEREHQIRLAVLDALEYERVRRAHAVLRSRARDGH